ncbi:hypothetical protein [Trinickia sp.]|uniref:hypothetical protein n=1 Tax=Trinickia sp. TaxID=2571163 RepID=UPI003F7D081F
MNTNEGMNRVVFALRAIGFLIATLGFLNPIDPERTAWLVLVIAAIIAATPFFALAWIIDGFAGAARREEREAACGAIS